MAKSDVTDLLIQHLLTMPKRVTNPNARMRVEGRHQRLDYSVVGEEEKQEFVLFLRQSTRLVTSFSAGLRWIRPGEEGVMLMRCNGSSHEHTNSLEGNTISFECHVHVATERYLSVGKRDEGYADAVQAYNSLDGALRELLARCNISGLPPGRGGSDGPQMSLLT